MYVENDLNWETYIQEIDKKTMLFDWRVKYSNEFWASIFQSFENFNITILN